MNDVKIDGELADVQGLRAIIRFSRRSIFGQLYDFHWLLQESESRNAYMRKRSSLVEALNNSIPVHFPLMSRVSLETLAWFFKGHSEFPLLWGNSLKRGQI